MNDIIKLKIEDIKTYFNISCPDGLAIIGISGGKDSSVAATLCVEALGKNRVFGVMMPVKNQSIKDSMEIIKFLDIKFLLIKIEDFISIFNNYINNFDNKIDYFEIAPKFRYLILNIISKFYNGRVIMTHNMSEDYVGYTPKIGDGAGHFNLFSDLTATEILKIGEKLHIPNNILEKAPNGEFNNKTDEEIMGLSYNILDKYIKTGECNNLQKNIIKTWEKDNLRCLKPIVDFYNFLLQRQ